MRDLCGEGGPRGTTGRFPGTSVRLDAKEVLERWDPQSIVKDVCLRRESWFSCFIACFGLKIIQHYHVLVLKYSLATVCSNRCNGVMWFYLLIFGQKKEDPSVLPQSSQQVRR